MFLTLFYLSLSWQLCKVNLFILILGSLCLALGFWILDCSFQVVECVKRIWFWIYKKGLRFTDLGSGFWISVLFIIVHLLRELALGEGLYLSIHSSLCLYKNVTSHLPSVHVHVFPQRHCQMAAAPLSHSAHLWLCHPPLLPAHSLYLTPPHQHLQSYHHFSLWDSKTISV